jgi:hypothetical protein
MQGRGAGTSFRRQAFVDGVELLVAAATTDLICAFRELLKAGRLRFVRPIIDLIAGCLVSASVVMNQGAVSFLSGGHESGSSGVD